MASKTQAMRILDGKKIPYEVYEYSPEIKDAEEVAEAVGFSSSEVYKTLVALTPTNVKLLVILASNRQLNLKLLAKHLNEKKLRMASYNEAESLTGLKVGGISALALINRGFKVFLDEQARGLEKLVISAGQRGYQVRVNVDDFVKLTNARFLDVAR